MSSVFIVFKIIGDQNNISTFHVLDICDTLQNAQQAIQKHFTQKMYNEVMTSGPAHAQMNDQNYYSIVGQRSSCKSSTPFLKLSGFVIEEINVSNNNPFGQFAQLGQTSNQLMMPQSQQPPRPQPQQYSLGPSLLGPSLLGPSLSQLNSPQTQSQQYSLGPSLSQLNLPQTQYSFGSNFTQQNPYNFNFPAVKK